MTSISLSFSLCLCLGEGVWGGGRGGGGVKLFQICLELFLFRGPWGEPWAPQLGRFLTNVSQKLPADPLHFFLWGPLGWEGWGSELGALGAGTGSLEGPMAHDKQNASHMRG